MIQSTPWILTVLLAIEASVLGLARFKRTKSFFKFLPAMFWIYFIPMLFSTSGILPADHPLYSQVTAWCLPLSLILLLLASDLRTILKLGKPALLMMLAAGFSVVFSGPAVVWLFRSILPEGSWRGLGVLSASWTGGSANMIALKEITQTPDNLFLPMVVVDTLISYSWMGFLIFLVPFQESIDRWNHSDRRLIDQLHERTRHLSLSGSDFRFSSVIFSLAAGALGAVLAVKLALAFPLSGGLSRSTWTILLASFFGILLSLTPARKWGSEGGSETGYFLLYFVLTSIGVRADLLKILSAPVLIMAGAVWVCLHGVLLFGVARIFKIPIALTATASQANIGGPASAPIVAALYEPGLAPVGLLLGIFGNITGTYMGLLCFELCRRAVS